MGVEGGWTDDWTTWAGLAASLMALLSYTGASGCALPAIALILTTEITLSVHKLTLMVHKLNIEG